MSAETPLFFMASVALLAEGVDRNSWSCKAMPMWRVSPSSRRAWIEIPEVIERFSQNAVALLAEGVDRNAQVCEHGVIEVRRPPRGGRG